MSVSFAEFMARAYADITGKVSEYVDQEGNVWVANPAVTISWPKEEDDGEHTITLEQYYEQQEAEYEEMFGEYHQFG